MGLAVSLLRPAAPAPAPAPVSAPRPIPQRPVGRRNVWDSSKVVDISDYPARPRPALPTVQV